MIDIVAKWKTLQKFHSFSKHCRKITSDVPFNNTFFQQRNKQQICQRWGLAAAKLLPQSKPPTSAIPLSPVGLLGTNAQLLATSLHTTPDYPLGRFLNNVYSATVIKPFTDSLSSRHSVSTIIQEAESLAGTSQSLF